MRTDYAALQGTSEDEASDLDLLAYLAIKYVTEVKKIEGYQLEIAEQQEGTALIERMHERSCEEIDEPQQYNRDQGQINDQRIEATTEENVAANSLRLQLAPTARTTLAREHGELATRDRQANQEIKEAQDKSEEVISLMRKPFNEATAEFTSQNLILR